MLSLPVKFVQSSAYLLVPCGMCIQCLGPAEVVGGDGDGKGEVKGTTPTRTMRISSAARVPNIAAQQALSMTLPMIMGRDTYRMWLYIYIYAC